MQASRVVKDAVRTKDYMTMEANCVNLMRENETVKGENETLKGENESLVAQVREERKRGHDAATKAAATEKEVTLHARTSMHTHPCTPCLAATPPAGRRSCAGEKSCEGCCAYQRLHDHGSQLREADARY